MKVYFMIYVTRCGARHSIRLPFRRRVCNAAVARTCGRPCALPAAAPRDGSETRRSFMTGQLTGRCRVDFAMRMILIKRFHASGAGSMSSTVTRCGETLTGEAKTTSPVSDRLCLIDESGVDAELHLHLHHLEPVQLTGAVRGVEDDGPRLGHLRLVRLGGDRRCTSTTACR